MSILYNKTLKFILVLLLHLFNIAFIIILLDAIDYYIINIRFFYQILYIIVLFFLADKILKLFLNKCNNLILFSILIADVGLYFLILFII